MRRQHGTPADRFQLILDNAARLRHGLSAISHVRCLSSETPTSGLVSFTVEGESNRRLCDELEKRQIIVRTISSPDCMRASVHYFSSEDEINQLVSALAQLIS
jgi:L-cysteine/cystine lyase